MGKQKMRREANGQAAYAASASHPHPHDQQEQQVVETVKAAPQGKIAAFFDLDQTVISGASSWLLTVELYKRGFFGLGDFSFAARQVAAYLLLGEGKKRVDKIVERALKVMAGHSQQEVREICTLVISDLERMLFPQMRSILYRHRAAGHDVWIISAAPTELPSMFAARIRVTGGVGSNIKVDENGFYLPELEGGLMHGAGKKQAMEALSRKYGYDLAKCYGYSDSVNDLPLLTSVGRPCAINPDFKLRYWARQHGWPVLDFRTLWRIRSLLQPRKRKKNRNNQQQLLEQISGEKRA